MRNTLVLISLLALGSLAQANQGDVIHAAIMQPPAFEDVDINKDGVISKDEAIHAKVMNEQDFAAADKDGNGMLSKNEYRRAVQAEGAAAQKKGG